MTETPRQPDPLRRLDPGEPRYHSLWRPKLDGAWYNPVVADNAVAFFPRYCRFTKKEWAGRPFHLEPWEADWIIKPAFGWMRADGTRLYRRVIVWVPRKNGKTELLGGVSHLCLLGDEVPGAECYSIASSGDQANIVFKAAKDMVVYSEGLAEHYETFEGSLYCKSTRGRFEPLTGKPRGKHGLGTTYLIGDEAHEWPNDQLYTFVRNAMASAAEPMEWIISTAGIEQGYGVDLWNESVGICEGAIDDPETLVVIWCAPQDPKREIDIEDPLVWAEANPNLGVSLKYDYMVRQAREAAQSARKENDFKRYHLNLWVGQAERWLPMPDWNLCESPPSKPGAERWQELEQHLAGRPCWGGLDLASTRDMNALVWWFPPQEAGERWHVLTRFWWPKLSLDAAAKKSRVPFESWARLGAIQTTPGNAADHAAIEEQIVADCGLFQVQGLGIDQFNAHSVATSLSGQGVPVMLVRFAMLSMSGPSKLLERAVLTHMIDHGAHPVLRWMANNVAIRRDKNGNYMPSKDDSAAKIDGIAALVIAIATSGAETVEAPSYLVSQSLMVL